MVWFLDTNLIVACLRGKSPAAMRRLQAVQASDVRVPLQVHAELLVGAAKSNNPIQAKARVLDRGHRSNCGRCLGHQQHTSACLIANSS